MSDLDIAKKEIKWFFKQYNISDFANVELNIQSEFKSVYPKTSELISKSKVSEFRLNENRYRLYGWKTLKGNSCGWLCKIEENINELDFVDDHKLLVDAIGGIKETWDEDDEIEATDALTINQSFLFVLSLCQEGIQFNEDYYIDICQDKNCNPIDNYKKFIMFAQELNGNMTLYNPENSEVFLYARDHFFDYVEDVEGQPEYTFYKIKGCDTFTDYVEKNSNDWLSIIDNVPAPARL